MISDIFGGEIWTLAIKSEFGDAVTFFFSAFFVSNTPSFSFQRWRENGKGAVKTSGSLSTEKKKIDRMTQLQWILHVHLGLIH